MESQPNGDRATLLSQMSNLVHSPKARQQFLQYLDRLDKSPTPHKSKCLNHVQWTVVYVLVALSDALNEGAINMAGKALVVEAMKAWIDQRASQSQEQGHHHDYAIDWKNSPSRYRLNPSNPKWMDKKTIIRDEEVWLPIPPSNHLTPLLVAILRANPSLAADPSIGKKEQLTNIVYPNVSIHSQYVKGNYDEIAKLANQPISDTEREMSSLAKHIVNSTTKKHRRSASASSPGASASSPGTPPDFHDMFFAAKHRRSASSPGTPSDFQDIFSKRSGSGTKTPIPAIKSVPSDVSEPSPPPPPNTSLAEHQRTLRKKAEADARRLRLENSQLQSSRNNLEGILQTKTDTENHNAKARVFEAETAKNLSVTVSDQQGFIATQQVKLEEEKEKRHAAELQIMKLMHTICERNMEITKLLAASKTKDNKFFKSLQKFPHPNALFYAIADPNFDIDDDDLLNEGLGLPSVMSCDLTLLKAENLPKFLEILKSSVCCYSAPLDVLLMLTASDDREEVTDDTIDLAYERLLPKIGFKSDHSFSFSCNDGKDYVLAIASRRNKGAAEGAIGLLTKVIAQNKDSQGVLQLDSGVSEGYAQMPFSAVDTAAILNGQASIDTLELCKMQLTCDQQRAFKIPQGQKVLTVSFDRVLFATDSDGKVVLLKRDLAKGEPLSLGFKQEAGIAFSELTDAIRRGRIGSLQFYGVRLKEGEEGDLAELIRTARAYGCSLLLEYMEHETKNGPELAAEYMEFKSLYLKAFSEKAPESTPPSSTVDDDKLKLPTYDI